MDVRKWFGYHDRDAGQVKLLIYSARQKKLDKLSRRNNTLLVYRMTLKFDAYLDETFV